MAFLTFLISLLALLMALDNRRSLVELKRRHRQITHKAKDLAPSKQGEAGVPSTKPQGLQYHPSQVPKTNDASHEPSSSSEAAPPPLPQSISQGSGFSDSSSSLNLDRGSHSNVQEKNVPPGDDSKVKGSTDQPRLFPGMKHIQWEMFMGARLFAWLGGLALFFAIAFLVKYSLDHDLIAPWLRIALGYLVSMGLTVGGIRLRRKELRVTSQTLAATGLVGLYSVTFAAYALYDFALFNTPVTVLLASITLSGAVFLADRWKSPLMAALGMLGGLLTPLLLDVDLGDGLPLFGFIGLLSVGILWVSLRHDWVWITGTLAFVTTVYQLCWFAQQAGGINWAMACLLTFPFALLYTAASQRLRRWGAKSLSHAAILEWPGFALLVMMMLFMGAHGATTLHPLWIGLYLLGVGGCLSRQSLLRSFVPRFEWLRIASLSGALACWSYWMGSSMHPAWLMLVCLLFGLLQFWMVARQYREASHPEQKAPILLAPLFPLMVILPMLPGFGEASWIVGVGILLLQCGLVALALVAGSLGLLVLSVLVGFGMFAMGVLSLDAFAFGQGLGFLWLLLPVAVLGWWMRDLTRWRAGFEALGISSESAISPQRQEQIQAIGLRLHSLLPYLLLILMIPQCSADAMHWVMGSTVFLGAMTLWHRHRVPGLDVAGLMAGCAAQAVWLLTDKDLPSWGWVLWVFSHQALFLLPPFLQKKEELSKRSFGASAWSSPIHFLLIHTWFKQEGTWSNLGILPLIYALMTFGLTRWLWQRLTVKHQPDQTILAWFAAATTLFVTLIFPIQFQHQWLTIGWAMEGAALIWLYRSIPHRGLLMAGSSLLAVAFLRLSLNPAILSYEARGDWALFNWYLYTYACVIGSLVFASHRMKQWAPKLKPWTWMPQAFQAMAVLLSFLLMNIEIADFFAPSGQATLIFEFGGHFGRDVTYSLSWSLFALAMMGYGLRYRIRESRWAGLGLLSMTLLKVFFHDMAQLDQLYRIAALVGVAIIAILSSVLYQRFGANAQASASESRPTHTES